MEISQEGISLIKKFEGCELESYKCAAGVWTIGYGSTHGVSKGMVITHERAEMLLGNSAQILGFNLPGIQTSGFYSPQALNVSDANKSFVAT